MAAGFFGFDRSDLNLSSDSEAQDPDDWEGDIVLGPDNCSCGGSSKDSGQTESDLIEFARSLGIDLNRESDLRWVAQEAFVIPLPASWTEHADSDGRIYFYNTVTGESSWCHPMDNVFREIVTVVKSARAERHSSDSRKAQVVQEHLQQAHQRAVKQLEGWSGPYLAPGHGQNYYYYNAVFNASTWDDPVQECHNELALRRYVLVACLFPGYRAVTEGQTLAIEAPSLQLASEPTCPAGSSSGSKSPNSSRSYVSVCSAGSARLSRSPTPSRAAGSPRWPIQEVVQLPPAAASAAAFAGAIAAAYAQKATATPEKPRSNFQLMSIDSAACDLAPTSDEAPTVRGLRNPGSDESLSGQSVGQFHPASRDGNDTQRSGELLSPLSLNVPNDATPSTGSQLVANIPDVTADETDHIAVVGIKVDKVGDGDVNGSAVASKQRYPDPFLAREPFQENTMKVGHYSRPTIADEVDRADELDVAKVLKCSSGKTSSDLNRYGREKEFVRRGETEEEVDRRGRLSPTPEEQEEKDAEENGALKAASTVRPPSKEAPPLPKLPDDCACLTSTSRACVAKEDVPIVALTVDSVVGGATFVASEDLANGGVSNFVSALTAYGPSSVASSSKALPDTALSLSSNPPARRRKSKSRSPSRAGGDDDDLDFTFGSSLAIELPKFGN